MEIFISWVLLSILMLFIAMGLKKDVVVTFIISIAFSPLVGLIFVLLSAPTGVKKCPKCAELVKNEAVKCRYCGTALELPASMILEKHMEKVDKEDFGRAFFRIVVSVLIVFAIFIIFSVIK